MGFKKSKKYPETTVGAYIFNNHGKLLLIRSRKWKDKYTVPGGHIELGENMFKALKREVKEETGLTVKNPKLFNVLECIYSKEFIKNKHFIFLEIFCKAKTTKLKIDNREAQSYIWIKPEDALKLNIDSYTIKSIKKYLKLKKRWIF